MGLHLKYRPNSLTSMWGNEDTRDSLDSVLSREDPPHSYLLTGPSGCGKTTLARIIKNKLGCSDYDFKEMDSADFRGIDHIRDIRKQMRLRPMAGKCRVWLLDECHQITKDAQAALLKALEDTPDHVYFILATTDPQKLLPTIKNRCSQFSVESLSPDTLFRGMRKIVSRERKKVPKEILRQIAKDAAGSPRAALVILDKIIDLPEERMAKAAEQQAAKENAAIDLCRAMMAGKSWKKVSQILKGIDEEPETIRRIVLGYFSTVLLSSGQERAFFILDCFRQPFYDIGRPGLIAACFEATTG